MGSLEKFLSADKLFWESSKVEITKIPGVFVKTREAYKIGLKKYYLKYGIDFLDNENIRRFFDFYPDINYLGLSIKNTYEDLKIIQKSTDDYVEDYLSYKKCLVAYYEKHGADTEWLVKIFAERYDLERFNISPEDVLDDLYEIMKTQPVIPSLK